MSNLAKISNMGVAGRMRYDASNPLIVKIVEAADAAVVKAAGVDPAAVNVVASPKRAAAEAKRARRRARNLRNQPC